MIISAILDGIVLIYTGVRRGRCLGDERHPLTYVGRRRFQHGPLIPDSRDTPPQMAEMDVVVVVDYLDAVSVLPSNVSL